MLFQVFRKRCRQRGRGKTVKLLEGGVQEGMEIDKRRRGRGKEAGRVVRGERGARGGPAQACPASLSLSPTPAMPSPPSLPVLWRVIGDTARENGLAVP
eukprot:888977-Rhodomonas_salina.1